MAEEGAMLTQKFPAISGYFRLLPPYAASKILAPAAVARSEEGEYPPGSSTDERQRLAAKDLPPVGLRRKIRVNQGRSN